MSYTTDLTLAEFKILEPLLPRTFLITRPPKWTKHEILNGIFYQLVNGCRWVDLPKDLPPSGTVFHWYNTWKKNEVWDLISQNLFVQSRLNQGKKRSTDTTTV